MTNVMKRSDRPELQWIAVETLSLDVSYQRESSERAGRTLVKRIAAAWSWAKCAPLIVAPATADAYVVIDGGHRLAAAKLAEISELPCYVLADCADNVAQAEAFLALNRDRVGMTPLQLHIAALVAGDEQAAAIEATVSEGGARLCDRQYARAQQKPGELICVGAVRVALRECGREATTRAIRALTTAYANVGGELTANLVKGVSRLIAGAQVSVDDARLAAVISERSADDWDDRAALWAKTMARPKAAAVAVVVGQAYDKKLSSSRRLQVAA